MRSFTAACAPVPSAIIAITAATPMTMPSIVRTERSLFARSALSATVIVSPNSIPSPSASAAARRTTTGSATGGTARTARAGTGVRREPRDAHALAHAVVLLLSLRLQCEGGQERHPLPFLEPGHDLRIVEVRGAEHNDARVICLVRAVDHENQSGMRAPACPAQLRRRELQIAATLRLLRAIPVAAGTLCERARLATTHPAGVRLHFLAPTRAGNAHIDAGALVELFRRVAHNRKIELPRPRFGAKVVEL